MCNHLKAIFYSEKKSADTEAQEILSPVQNKIKNVNFHNLETGLFPEPSLSTQEREDCPLQHKHCFQ